MAGSCGAFCAFCGKCGREIPKEMLANKPKNVPPPGVALDQDRGPEHVAADRSAVDTDSCEKDQEGL